MLALLTVAIIASTFLTWSRGATQVTPGLASAVTKPSGVLTFTAVAGETNIATIALAGSTYTITDSGSTITAPSGCTAVDAHTVTCSSSGITSIVMNGDDGNDTLRSSSSTPATINGGTGNDTIIGGPGNDTLIGGAGTDLADYSWAGAGVTVSMSTAGGQNTIGAGTDSLSEFENLTGSAYGDTLTGDDNPNTIRPRLGTDQVNGGLGTDKVDYTERTTTVSVSLDEQGNDGVAAEGDNIHSDVEDIATGSGADILTGDSHANNIIGNGGNDSIEGGLGDDTLTGGSGTDTLSYAGSGQGVTVSFQTASQQDTLGAGRDTVTTFENLTGSGSNDYLVGDLNANVIDGGSGSDLLSPFEGTDTIIGGSGFDTATYWNRTNPLNLSLDGGANDGETGENDTIASDVEGLRGGAGNDTLTGDDQANTLTGDNGNDKLAGNGENDTLTGGSGTDTADYSSASDPVSVSLATGQSSGGAGADTLTQIEDLIGSGSGDSLTGSTGPNTITAGAGVDTINPLAGVDSVNAGSGDDRLTMRDGSADTAACGDGNDQAILDDGNLDSSSNCESISTSPATTITSGLSEGASTADQHAAFGFSSDTGVSFECAVGYSAPTNANFSACSSPFAPVAGWGTTGSKILAVRAVDGNGIVDPTPAFRHFSVDVTAPVITWTSYPTMYMSGTTRSVGFTSDDAAATYDCAIDAQSFTSCGTPFQATSIAYGLHYFRVRGTDALGNATIRVGSQFRVFDPATVIQAPDGVPAVLGTGNSDFEVTSAFPVPAINCHVNGTDPATSNENHDCSLPFSIGLGWPEGNYRIVFQAAGATDGPIGDAKSFDFALDRTAPGVVMDNPRSNGEVETTASHSFEFHSPSADVDHFVCQFNSGEFVDCESPLVVNDLQVCRSHLAVRAYDHVGNVSETEDDVTFDSNPSDVNSEIACLHEPLNPDPDHPEWMEAGSWLPAMSYTGWVEGHEMPIGTVKECKVNNRPWVRCNQEDPRPRGVNGPGLQTFSVRTTYDGRVESSPATVSWMSNLQPVEPDTTLLSVPEQHGSNAAPTVTFSSSDGDATFECRLDSGAWTACASPYTIAVASGSNSPNGDHSFEVRSSVYGLTEQMSAHADFNVNAALIAPVITIGPADGDLVTDGPIRFAFASLPWIASFECAEDGGAFSACTSPHELASNNAAKRHFAVRAVDALGNRGASTVRTIRTAGTSALSISSVDTIISGGPAAGSVVAGGRVKFEFDASSTEATFKCSLDGAVATDCDSPLALTGLGDGGHTFSVAAMIENGPTDATPAVRTFSVATDENLRPETILDPSPELTDGIWSSKADGSSPTFSFRSTVADSTFECRIDDDEWKACDSPFKANYEKPVVEYWIPRTFAVRATSNGQTDDSPATASFYPDSTEHESIEINVLGGGVQPGPDEETPFIDGITFSAGAFSVRAKSISLASLDPTGLELSCSIDGAPYHLCGSTFAVTGLSNGHHRLAVRSPAISRHPALTEYREFTVDPNVDADETPTTTGPVSVTFGPVSEQIEGATTAFGFATNSSGAQLECRIDTDAFAPCTSPYSTPELTNGDHSFAVREKSQAGVSSLPTVRSFSVDVAPVANGYDDIVERSPGGGAQLTSGALNEVKGALLDEIDGYSEAYSAGGGTVLGPGPAVISDQLQKFGVLPSKNEFMKARGFVQAGTETPVALHLHAGIHQGRVPPPVQRSSHLAYLFRGGDYHPGNRQQIVDGLLFHSEIGVYGWGYKENYTDPEQSRLEIVGLDIRYFTDTCMQPFASCWGPLFGGEHRLSPMFHPDPGDYCYFWPSGTGGPQRYSGFPEKPSFGALADAGYPIVQGNLETAVDLIDCIDGSVPEGHLKWVFPRVTEWLSPEAAYDVMLRQITRDDCVNSCPTLNVDLDSMDRGKAAAACKILGTFCNRGLLDGILDALGGGGPGAADPVDTFSGNFATAKTDLSVAGRGPELNLTRTYNSRDTRTSALGRGWSWAGSAGALDIAGETVKIIQENGRTFNFTKNSDGSYNTPAGHDERLVRVDVPGGDQPYFALSDPYGGSVTRYDEHGRIIDVTDKSGNKVTYGYDTAGRLSSQINADNQSISYSYSTDGLLQSATDSNGRTVFYDHAGVDLSGVTNPENGRVSYTYDGAGLLLTATDPDGRQSVSNVYDSDGRVITQLVGADENWSFEYGDHTTRATDATGRSTVYRFNANGDPSSTVAADDSRTEYHRDAAGNVTSVTHPDGSLTTYEYDAHNRLVTETTPGGRTHHYSYDTNGNRISESDGLNHATQYEFDSNNDMVSKTDPLGNETAYEYSAPGKLSATVDALGHRSEFTYTSEGQLSTSKNALGGITTYAYDESGNLETSTDPMGHVSHIETLPMGDVESVTDPLNHTTSFEYDDSGHNTSVTKPNGTATNSSYDTSGRLVETSLDGHVQSRLRYDASGDVSSEVDARGGTVSYGRDPAGKVVRQTDQEGGTTTTGHDVMGRTSWETDPRGSRTRFKYDVAGNLIEVADALGGSVSYTYDQADRQTSKTDPRGNVTTYQYDATNRETQIQQPLGLTTSFAYDSVGNLVSRSVGSETTTYTYDAENRVTAITLADQSTEQFAYDGDGRLVSAIDPSGRNVQFVYDAANRVTSTTDALGKTTTFGYDANGNNITRTIAGDTTTTAYDAFDRVASITTPSGRLHSFEYDAGGNLIGRKTSRASISGSRVVLDEQNFYDLANRLTRAYTRNGDGKTVSNLRYRYDESGNPSLRETSGSSQKYVYDALDRLTSVGFGGHTDSYTYDAAGNRATKNGQSYQYDALNQMTSAPGGEAFTYDQQGRLASESSPAGAASYAYDSLDRLTAKTDPVAGALNFDYDALGRVAQTTGESITRTYSYALDDRPLAESTHIGSAEAAATRKKSYAYGPRGLLETQTNDAAPTYPALDEHGSVLAEVTESGEAANKRDYDPFGVEIESAAQPDPSDPLAALGDESFGYLGGHGRAGVYGSDQIHMGARIYDPQSGRFISRDPLPGSNDAPQSQDPYAYALNNPMHNYDLDGRETITRPFPGPLDLPQFDGPAFWDSTKDAVARGWANAKANAKALAGAVAAVLGKGPKDPDEGGENGSDNGSGSDHELSFRKDTSHIFRNARGHLQADTPENRALLRDAVHPDNFVGTRGPGGAISVYRKLLADGRQVWVEVRNGTEITNGGVNIVPR
jgi:RHS repeat-associated protein